MLRPLVSSPAASSEWWLPGSASRFPLWRSSCSARATHERFAGAAALARRARPVPGRVQPRRDGGPACASSPMPPSTSYGGSWPRWADPPGAWPRWAGPCRPRVTKKKSVYAIERDTAWVRALRASLLEALQTEGVTCFKFVDETSTNLTYCRRYARAEGGQRAHQVTHTPARRTECDADGRPDSERAASGDDRERDRQRRGVRRLPRPGAQPHARPR